MKFKIFLFLFFIGLIVLIQWLSIWGHVIFWLYALMFLFQFSMAWKVASDIRKLDPDNFSLQNYLSYPSLFTSSTAKKKMGKWRNALNAIKLPLELLVTQIFWPIILYRTLKLQKIFKEINAKKISSITEYGKLYPINISEQLLTLTIGSILMFLQYKGIKFAYLLPVAIMFSFTLLYWLYKHLESSGTIINSYKKSVRGIRYNSIVTYSLAIINFHIFAFLLINHFVPGQPKWALLNQIKNEFLWISTINALIEWDSEKLKNIQNYFYILSVIGLGLKASVVVNFTQAWKAKRDELDMLHIINGLIKTENYAKADELFQKTTPNPSSELYRSLRCILLVIKEKYQEAATIHENAIYKDSKYGTDLAYRDICVYAKEKNLSDEMLLKIFEAWILSSEYDSMVATGVEMLFLMEREKASGITKILEKHNLSDVFPMTYAISAALSDNNYDFITATFQLLEKYTAPNMDSIFCRINLLTFIFAFADSYPADRELALDGLNWCIENQNEPNERLLIASGVSKCLSLQTVLPIDPLHIKALENARARILESMHANNDPNYLESIELGNDIILNIVKKELQ